MLFFCVSLHAQTNYFGGVEPFSGEEVIQIPQEEIKETEIFIYEDNIRPPQPQFRVRDNVIIPLENGIEQPQKRIEIYESNPQIQPRRLRRPDGTSEMY